VRGGAHNFLNLQHHSAQIGVDLVIPKPQNRESQIFQIFISFLIIPRVFFSFVLGSVNFNDYFLFQTNKIDNVFVDNVLTPKFQVAKISVFNPRPQSHFLRRFSFAKASRMVLQSWRVVFHFFVEC